MKWVVHNNEKSRTCPSLGMADPDPHQMTDSATPAQLETLNLIKGQNILGKKHQYSVPRYRYTEHKINIHLLFFYTIKLFAQL